MLSHHTCHYLAKRFLRHLIGGVTALVFPIYKPSTHSYQRTLSKRQLWSHHTWPEPFKDSPLSPLGGVQAPQQAHKSLRGLAPYCLTSACFSLNPVHPILRDTRVFSAFSSCNTVVYSFFIPPEMPHHPWKTPTHPPRIWSPPTQTPRLCSLHTLGLFPLESLPWNATICLQICLSQQPLSSWRQDPHQLLHTSHKASTIRHWQTSGKKYF